MTNPFRGRPEGVPLGVIHRSWWGSEQLTLSSAELQTHMHVIGVSGAGKSRFLAGLFLALLEAGLPATLVDPHGDLAPLVLAHLVARGVYQNQAAYERIRYLDLPAAERQGRFAPLNVLNQASAPHTTARAVLEALRRAWPALDGGAAPTFENIVLAGSFVLIHHRLPLTLLHDLLVETAWRNALLARVPDQTVTRFFTDRYDRWARQHPELIESTLRRIFLLAFSPIMRYSLAQPENLFDFHDIYANQRSLIVNLALPDLDARRLLGCLLTVAAEQAALSRDLSSGGVAHGSHHLILDEFAEFTAQSEASLTRILSHTRKYGLFVVMAHQTWSQASERLRGALQNVGVEAVFRCGRLDAEHAARTLGRVDPLAVKHALAGEAAARSHPAYFNLLEQWEGWVQAIEDLPSRQAYVKRAGQPAVRIQTLEVVQPPVDAAALRAVEEAYLARYFRPQEEIEQRISRIQAQMRPTTTRMRPLRR